MVYQVYGLVYRPILHVIHAVEQAPVYAPVPLKDVTVNAHMVDTCVEVVISQTYQNHENMAIEAEYLFPLDERAAVCEFVAEVDGRLVVGEIHEKEQAKQIYDAAVARGDGAFLLTQEKEDVFRAKIGNVLPGSTVVVKITYVAELKTEESAVRFLLPTTVAPRYTSYRGSESSVTPFVNTTAAALAYGLSLNLKCTMLNDVVSVTSPSHSALLAATINGRDATASLTQSAVMDKDLVILVQTVQPLIIQACLETDTANKSHAAMLTLCPHFEFAERKTECIFIVDRSGSMGGAQIMQARAALVLFLRSLPNDCYLNVIGFGSSMQKLWPTSVKYDQRSMLHATQHAQNMNADLGGTEILEPLKAAIGASPHKGYAREIFVLTDGQVNNTDAVCKYIRDNQERARVFALGIGDAVSRALVEGMARAGNGTAKFVTQGARMEPAVIGQLRQATQPSLKNVVVNWGVSVVDESASLAPPAPVEPAPPAPMIKSLLGYRSPTASSTVNTRPLPVAATASPIKQAPCELPPVFSDERFQCYLLLEAGQPLPKRVTITADTPDGPLNAEAEITEETSFEGNLIHRMAARSLLRDLDDGTSALHEAQAQTIRFPFRYWWHKSANEQEVRNESVKISKRYNVVSKYTSFVAVEHRTTGERIQCGWTVARQVPTAAPASQAYPAAPTGKMFTNSYSSSMAGGRGGGGGGGGGFFGAASMSRPAAAAAPPQFLSRSTGFSAAPAQVMTRSAGFAFGGGPTPSAAPSSSSYGYQSNPPPAPTAHQFDMMFTGARDASAYREKKASRRSEAQPMDCDDEAEAEEAQASAFDQFTFQPQQSQHQRLGAGDALSHIVLLQTFEGSFTLDANLAGICGVDLNTVLDLVKQSVSGKDDATLRNIAGSILALAFFEKRLADRSDEWNMIAGKARRWANANCGSGVVQSLLSQISHLL